MQAIAHPGYHNAIHIAHSSPKIAGWELCDLLPLSMCHCWHCITPCYNKVRGLQDFVTPKQFGYLFQNLNYVIIFIMNVTFSCEISPIQWLFSQHSGHWLIHVIVWCCSIRSSVATVISTHTCSCLWVKHDTHGSTFFMDVKVNNK